MTIRKISTDAIDPGSITETLLHINVSNKVNAAYNTANTANSAGSGGYDQANNAYSQANAAYGSANAAIVIGQNAYSQANAAYGAANTKLSTSGGSISGDLAITGNLTVQGNATTINVTNLSVNDSMILLSTNAVGDSNDIGFIGHFDRDATATHAGLIRKATENRFYLFDNYEVEPSNNVIDVAGNNFRVGNLRLGIVNANSFVTAAGLDVTGQANAAYGQANAAYGAANNRVLKAGDTMTGQLNISSGGLLVTGNVGIGTANPGGLLHLNDINNNRAFQLAFGYESTQTHTVGRNFSTGNLEFKCNVNNHGFLFDHTADGTKRFNITNMDVGIGTTNPSAKLHSYTSTSQTALLLTGDSGNEQLVIQRYSNTNEQLILGFHSSDYASIQAVEQSVAYRPLVLQRDGGAVGVGITNPSVKFHVAGASIIANNTSIDPDSYANQVIAGAIADGSGWGVTSAIGGNAGTGDSWAIGHNGSALYFGMQNGSAADTMQTYIQFETNRNLLLVPTSGNVGIGTTSPAERLDIFSGRIKLASSGSGYGWIYGLDTNHSIILRGNRDGTAGNFNNYYQFGGNFADSKGHRFWTGGALASQTEKFRISDDAIAVYTTFTRGINYWDGSPGSYSAGGSAVQTQYGPEIQPFTGWKELAIISTRAYHDYMDIKTNITSDGIMFWFKFMGYNYGYGNTYYFGGGYTYLSDVINKSMGTGNKLLGNAYVYDLYRATSDNALCVKIYLGQQGYTEGRTHVHFSAHNGDVARSASIVSSVVYNSTSRYF